MKKKRFMKMDIGYGAIHKNDWFSKSKLSLHIVYFCIILRTLTSLVDEQKHNNGTTVMFVTREVALVTYLLLRKRASNIALISRY